MGQQILMKQKYCLESVVPFRSINQSPINTSKAKETFSFSKSPRFPTPNPTCPLVSYGGDQILRKNSGAGIGYGKRYDLIQGAPLSPSSHKYRIKTIFDQNQQRHKGYSLRFSREELAANSYINHQLFKVPGVGNYLINNKRMATEGSAPVYSLRQKTKIINKLYSIQPQNDNPSAAQYNNNPEDLTKSIARRFKSVTYTNARSKRFENYDNRLPGPGQYEKTNISRIGRSVVNAYHNASIKFDQSRRVTEFQEAEKNSGRVPGPGSYRLGSEFGQYDGDVYKRDSLAVRSKH